MKRFLLATAAIMAAPVSVMANGPVTLTVNDARFTAQNSVITPEAEIYEGVSFMREISEGNRSGHVLMRDLTITGGTIQDVDTFGLDCAPSETGRKVFVSGSGLESYADGDASADNAPREKFSSESFEVVLQEGANCFGQIQADLTGLSASAADGSLIIAQKMMAMTAHKKSVSMEMNDVRAYGPEGTQALRAGQLMLTADADQMDDLPAATMKAALNILGVSVIAGKENVTGDLAVDFSCAPTATSMGVVSNLPGILVMDSQIDLVGTCTDMRSAKIASGVMDVEEGKGFSDAARTGFEAIISGETSAPPFLVAGLTMKKAQAEGILDMFAKGGFEADVEPAEPVGLEQLMGSVMMGEEALKKTLGFTLTEK